MSMAARIFGFSSATAALPGVTRRGRVLKSLWSFQRTLRNRVVIGRLQDWDDDRLMDIGLTRSDVETAFETSTFFEDPSLYLTNAARRRARRPYSLRD